MSLQPHTPSRPSEGRRTSSMAKRVPAHPKPASLVLDPSVLVAQHCQFAGTQPITVGAYTVLHPHSKINSSLAPVVLGEGVIVYERVKIGWGSAGHDASGKGGARFAGAVRDSRDMATRPEGTVVGRNVVIETGAVVEAAEVGEGTIIEVGAVLGRGCVIGKHCTICPMTVLPPNTVIPDFTVVYSGTRKRTDKTLQSRPDLLEAKTLAHRKQLEMFKRLIANNISKWQ